MNDAATAPAVLLLSVAAGYVLGSLPSGILVCRPLGKDPRAFGSGRTGGTNVYRTAGLSAAILTVALDVAKGYLAVALAEWLVERSAGASWTIAAVSPYAMSGAALGAILGHNYSVWAGFKGGAGTSPNLGAVLRLDPIALVGAALAAGLTLIATRMASVASLVASGSVAALLAARVIRGDLPPGFLLYAIGQLALVVWALRPNLRRLRQGTERRIGQPEADRPMES